MSKRAYCGEGFERIGSFSVDAGIVWIGDPCYIDANDTPPFDNWPQFCEILENKVHHQFKEGVVVSTMHGDGTYPVYAILTERGGLRGVFIDFDGVLDEDE